MICEAKYSPGISKMSGMANSVPRVARASRLPCDASCVAPGGRQLANEPLSTPGCVPRDAEHGRRDARATRDTPCHSLNRNWYEVA